MNDNLFKWLSFSNGHALAFVASESNRHAKQKRLHTAATLRTANLKDGDGDTSAGHVCNQLLFVRDSALGEVYYGTALRDIRIWASAVGLVDGLNRRPVKSPLEKVWLDFFLKKSVLVGCNFIPKQFRVVIGSSCRQFLQPKKRKIVLYGPWGKNPEIKRVN